MLLTVAGYAATAEQASARARPACEATAPTLERPELTAANAAGVGIEDRIDPDGYETTYEIAIVWRELHSPERGEPLPGGPIAQLGRLPAGNSYVTVKVFLTGLQPGYTYFYRARASNLGGLAESGAYPFGYLNSGEYPNGEGSGPPYESEISQCQIEAGEEAAELTVLEQRAKEAAIEAAEQEVVKREREQEEEEAERAQKASSQNVATAVARCVVPALKGDTLQTARRAISKTHCRLGSVHVPRGHQHGKLVVIRQSVKHGRALPYGTHIAISLAVRR